MRDIRCPECHRAFQVEGGERPVCPGCGFSGALVDAPRFDSERFDRKDAKEVPPVDAEVEPATTTAAEAGEPGALSESPGPDPWMQTPAESNPGRPEDDAWQAPDSEADSGPSPSVEDKTGREPPAEETGSSAWDDQESEPITRGPSSRVTPGDQAQDEDFMDGLDQRLMRGEISESTYYELRQKYGPSPAPRHCPSCGTALSADYEGASACLACGYPLRASTGASGAHVPGPAGGTSGAPTYVGIAAGHKFCSNCGSQIDARAEICPHCGVRVAGPVTDTQEKNPGVAAVLSALWIGLGQIYNGEVLKGLLFMVFGVIALLSIIVLIGFILAPLFWIYNIFDAYTTAKEINAGRLRV